MKTIFCFHDDDHHSMMIMVSMITDPNLVDVSGYIYIADSCRIKKRFMRCKIYEEECLLFSTPISIVYMKDKDM